MEKFRKNYTSKFVDELKPNFIGLPSGLAIYLANLINKSLGDELLEPLNANSTEAEKYQHNEALKACINCTLFKVLNLRVTQDFQAYIVEHEFVEISSLHRDNLKEDSVEVRPISNQRDMERRWLAVKMFIDQSNLSQLVKSIFDRQVERDKDILFRAYGIFGFNKATVRDLAAEYDLSKARVYQILNLIERNTKRRFNRTAYIVKSRADQKISNTVDALKLAVQPPLAADPALVDWLKELGSKLNNHRISFASAFDYLSLKFPDEYLVLKKLVPFCRDTESFFNFVSGMNNRLVPPKSFGLDESIIRDTYLIEKLTNIDITALPLPARTIKCLKASDIQTADQLARLTIDQMLRMPNLGRKSINSILELFNLYES